MAVSQLQRIYRQALSASIAELTALEGRIAARLAAGEPPSITIITMKSRIEANISDIRTRLDQAAESAVNATKKGQIGAAELANKLTEPLVQAAAGKPPVAGLSVNFSSLPDEQLQRFAGFLGDGSPLRDIFDELGTDTADALQSALVKSISLGENPMAVVAQIKKMALDITLQRVELIARTEMIRSARAATMELYKVNPAVNGYVRMATQDARVCVACLALSGTFHATSEIMPSHPNCRCVMIPKTQSWAEITGDASIPDTRPPVLTPDRILAGLNDSEIQEIMGEGRYRLWKEGKPLADFVRVKPNQDWGPTTSVIPLREFGIVVKPRRTARDWETIIANSEMDQ